LKKVEKHCTTETPSILTHLVSGHIFMENLIPGVSVYGHLLATFFDQNIENWNPYIETEFSCIENEHHKVM